MLPVRSLLVPRHVAFVVVLVLGLGYEGWALFLQPHGLARNGGGPIRLVGEVAGGMGVRQTFRMDADGLDGIAVRARPAGAVVSGEAVLELGEVVGAAGSAGVYRIVRPAVELTASRSYWWRFPPLERSRGKRYSLDIRLPDTPGGAGIQFEATTDNVYRQGLLVFGDREQWGDLVFETSAARATVFAGLESLWQDLPWGLGAAWFWVVFVVFNVALGIALHALLLAHGTV